MIVVCQQASLSDHRCQTVHPYRASFLDGFPVQGAMHSDLQLEHFHLLLLERPQPLGSTPTELKKW